MKCTFHFLAIKPKPYVCRIPLISITTSSIGTQSCTHFICGKTLANFHTSPAKGKYANNSIGKMFALIK